MFDPNSPESGASRRPVTRDGPNVQAFIARHRPSFILAAVLVAQLLLLSLQITRNHDVRLIRVWAVAVVDPFQRSLRAITDISVGAWRTYRHLLRAQQENQELRMQLASAQSQLLQLSEQAAESGRLRALLDFKNQLPFQTVAAEVIASSPGENSNAIFIGKGVDAGLTSDLAVITPEGVIGKTIAVFSHSSQVLLLTDPSSGVGIMLEKTRVQGVLKGDSRNLCLIRYIMNEEPVAFGEAVLTSGLDQIYPKGLRVGSVVGTSAGNIYKNVEVKPAADLSRLETVLVVLRPNSTEQQALNARP
ncbi:MAG TPA: rod shape-determining protein MreC [Terriglobia bacterium]|nr:rod shape-determining protein MreC [Terriglobia bacterium]